LLLDSRRFRGLRREGLDVTVALEIARGLQQLQVQAFQAPFLSGRTTAAQPIQHGSDFAARRRLDAPPVSVQPVASVPQPAAMAMLPGASWATPLVEEPRMNEERGPDWAKPVLLAAAGYNLVFGALVVSFPSAWFDLAGLPRPNHPSLWQCIGMIVGVYGIGYGIAAYAPLRHWPIVLVGLCGKVLGPLGFLDAAWRGELPWRCGWLIVANDLIWWLPFAALLLATRARHRRSR
jgi:hypothetical protein